MRSSIFLTQLTTHFGFTHRVRRTDDNSSCLAQHLLTNRLLFSGFKCISSVLQLRLTKLLTTSHHDLTSKSTKNSAPKTSNTMYLPLELQRFICRGLTKAELKAARLVCKSLYQAATPFLFDEVFVAASYSDLEVADLVASRFGTYVKTVTLSSVVYKSLSMEQFRQETESRTKTLERSNDHLKHTFEVYCGAQKEYHDIDQSGELMERLCLILNKTPKCRKMILTDYGNDGVDDTSTARHEPLKEDNLCPFEVCSLSVSDHLDFHFRPTSPYQKTPNSFHIAMLAISRTKSTITELAMIHHGEEDGREESFLSEESFGVTAWLSYCSTVSLQQLSRLRIRLYVRGAEPCMDRPIAKALSSAVSLESLFIEGGSDLLPVEPYMVTKMSTFLEGCRFPKLKSLILMAMDSKEDELLEFLKTSPCLKHLTMEFFLLSVGSWESVAQRIRSVLQLKSVMLDALSGGLWSVGDDYISEHSSKDKNLVERFFLHNGKNPFTRSAMDLWFDRDDDEGYYFKKAQNSEKRYEMLG